VLSGCIHRYGRGIYPGRCALLVGYEAAVRCPELIASQINWIAMSGLDRDRAVGVRIRHASADVPAVIAPAPGGRVAARFETWPRAAAPGQAIAFYDGEVVVGGGGIDEVRRVGLGGGHEYGLVRSVGRWAACHTWV